MGFLVIVIIAVVVVLYFVGVYNKFVRKRSMMDEGWSGIDVQLKKRHDLIPNLVETVKGYAKHEQETLNRVIEARNSALKAEGVKAQTVAENQLNSALANVFALSEAYPDLKANTNFIQLQQELSAIEGDVEKSPALLQCHRPGK
jgi:LemA protein